MADLITMDDVEAVVGEPATAADAAKRAYYIKSISSFVNGYVDASFAVVADDVKRLQSDYYGIITLPGYPTSEVTSVVSFDTGLATSYYHDGMGSLSGLDPLQTVDVTYTHGFAEVPEDVTELVLSAVLGALGVANGGTLKQLDVGGVSEVFGDVTGALVVTLAQSVLDRYKVTSWTMRLGGTPGFRGGFSL